VDEVMGKRERNAAERRGRILAAATSLFLAQGYAGTTTQQVSVAARVPEATLFRYAGTKAELLLMVMNARLEEAWPVATSVLERETADSIVALLAPYVRLADEQPENMVGYLREVTFGEPGAHRDAALALVDRTVSDIDAALLASVPPVRPGADVAQAGRLVFSVLVLELGRMALGRGPERGRTHELPDLVRLLLEGILQQGSAT
jgi:AcrR family transcriptional regulator